MSQRSPLSKRTRFEVFKRDLFTCQYCGAHPPAVVLECDHIIPVAEGGGNDDSNLVTSCFDCNRGKSSVPLEIAPKSLDEKAIEIQEREAQIAGYREVMQKRLDRIEDDMWQVAFALVPNASENGLRRDWLRSIKMFNEKLPLHGVLDAAEHALAMKRYSEIQRFKYFCGICWNKIREGHD